MFDNFFVSTHLDRAEDNLAAVVARLEAAYPQDWTGGAAQAYHHEVTDAIAVANALRTRIGYIRAKVA